MYPAPALNPPALPKAGHGEEGSARQGEGEHFHGLREYQMGDPLRRIAWKTSARHQKLYSRVMESPSEDACEINWYLMRGGNTEEKLSIMTAWILRAERLQIPYSLEMPTAALPPDLGEEHRDACLKFLPVPAMINPQKKAIFWVIASLSVAMAPQIVRMPLTLVAITLFPLLWRIAAERFDWKELPALVRHAATGAALLTLFFSYGNVTGRRAAVSLLTVMLAMKLIESYRIRDARLIVSFSLFLCATQFLFSQSILMPFYGAVSVMIALVALTQLHRNEAFENLGETPPVTASIFSELGFSFRLLALAVPVGLAFFLFFPTLGKSLVGNTGNNP